jgi:hypothetical protein
MGKTRLRGLKLIAFIRRLKPRLHKQNPPARVEILLVRAGGLRLCSREFYSPGLIYWDTLPPIKGKFESGFQ